MLRKEGKLGLYKVDAENKKHQFWQRDSLAIHLYSREVAFQKLKYIHNNPWQSTGNWLKTRVIISIHQPDTYELNEKRFLVESRAGEASSRRI